MRLACFSTCPWPSWLCVAPGTRSPKSLQSRGKAQPLSLSFSLLLALWGSGLLSRHLAKPFSTCKGRHLGEELDVFSHQVLCSRPLPACALHITCEGAMRDRWPW